MDIGTEFSECVMRNVDGPDGPLEFEWTRRGHRGVTLVSDPLIEEWAAKENERRTLRKELALCARTLDLIAMDGPQEAVPTERRLARMAATRARTVLAETDSRRPAPEAGE